jgi:hypothetical protein
MVIVVAVLMAAGCLAFTAVNVFFEVTDRFGDGPAADYASGLTVMNWFVVVLKVVGAAVALLSVSRLPSPVPPVLLGVALWGAFTTLGVYGLGSVLEAVGMATGVAGTIEDIDLAGIGYVLGFLFAAAGFGVLAVSYSRRNRLPKRVVALGALGAPVTLGLVLLAVPALLVAVGVMPDF